MSTTIEMDEVAPGVFEKSPDQRKRVKILVNGVWHEATWEQPGYSWTMMGKDFTFKGRPVVKIDKKP